MTRFCQYNPALIAIFCLVCLLLLPIVSFASAPQGQVSFEDAPLRELQRENTDLARKVRRLEQQVAAQREELSGPGATEIFGGIGYIVGVFGFLGWRAARKQTAAGSK